jgi:hypothetical protein
MELEKCEEKGLLGRPSSRFKIILKWILKEWGGRMWVGFIWLRTGTSGDPWWI